MKLTDDELRMVEIYRHLGTSNSYTPVIRQTDVEVIKTNTFEQGVRATWKIFDCNDGLSGEHECQHDCTFETCPKIAKLMEAWK